MSHLLPRNRLVLSLLALAVLAFCFEGYRAYSIYKDASAARDSLLSIQNDVDIGNLGGSDDQVLAAQPRLRDALAHTQTARASLSRDPLVWLAARTPVIGKQVRGLQNIVAAAQDLEEAGLMPADISVAFNKRSDDPNLTSIQEAVAFIQDQNDPMQQLEAKLAELQRTRSSIPNGLAGPLAEASRKVDSATEQLHEVVIGYARAEALLPRLLGYNGSKRYLLLPQNDTELFPSGGLISSYGVVTFENGAMKDISLEYFGTLYDRWQAKTHEYIEPPLPLKTLKQKYSWSLGEAGWYPDFAKTAELARSFVAKGGAPSTDGVIAIDTQFMQALIELLGPVYVPDYNVTVTPENMSELTEEMTRDDYNAPAGTQHKAFLSSLARVVMNEVFVAPKDKWVGLLNLMDRMARERHLQLNFSDRQLQSLTSEYGLDGGIESPKGDFLLVADTSVSSTKLHMILKKSINASVQLNADGSAASDVRYSLMNPFPEWQVGRDPQLVKALMYDGVYGSYLRVYAPLQSELRGITVNDKPAGAEQADQEVGKKAFGHYFNVRPGATASMQVSYTTPQVIDTDGKLRHYHLYVQKEAGTNEIPLSLNLKLPDGARLVGVTLDGESYAGGLQVKTDLREDRTIEVTYRLP